MDHAFRESEDLAERDQDVLLRTGKQAATETYRVEFSKDPELNVLLERKYEAEEFRESRRVKHQYVRCTGGEDWGVCAGYAILDGLLVVPLVMDLVFIAPKHDLFKHNCNYYYERDVPIEHTRITYTRTVESWRAAPGEIELKVGESSLCTLAVDTTGKARVKVPRASKADLPHNATATLEAQSRNGEAHARIELTESEFLKLITSE